jgi:LmbE family N-acetylglucosaminyl deacetylase
MNRDHLERLMEAAREAGIDLGGGEEEPGAEGDVEFGMPEVRLTTAVDVRRFAGVKRRSMACHTSQITDSSFFLQMPEEIFAEVFGTEWFIRRGAPAGIHEDELALPPVA